MPNHRVTHDPNDPDFPHGTRAGRSRGCGCEDCVAGSRRQEKIRQAHRDRTGKPYAIPTEVVAAHIRGIMDRTGVKSGAIARAAGVSESSVIVITKGGTRTVRRQQAARILAVTDEQALAAPGAIVPAKLTVQLIRSMQVQGFTIMWQAEQANLSPNRLLSITRRANPDLRVRVETQTALQDLAKRVGGSTGPSPRIGRMTRKAGWHPLAAYDDNGDLIPEAVTDDPEAAQAELMMRVMQLTVDEMSVSDIVERTGCTNNYVRQVRAAAGVQVTRAGKVSRFVEPERVKEVERVCRLYEWESWTAAKALAELGLPVIAGKRSTRPKRAA